MNQKTVLHIVLLLALASLATGCCTQHLVEYSHGATSDRFLPSTVYQATNSGSFAIAGTLNQHLPGGQAFWMEGHEKDKIPSYLIIPDGIWRTPTSPTNSDAWIQDLERSWPTVEKGSRLENSLPSNYEKVGDPQKYYVTLPITGSEHRINSGWIALTPVTAVADIVTFPIQLIGYGMLALWGRC